ncbi:MAG: hypothetical protein QOC81_49 [Thermoanaerobaculia bacterium]|nr:hypothetical protein [Thermoanaerobaculia bacterium]
MRAKKLSGIATSTFYSGRLRGRRLRRSLRSPGGARGHVCGARLRARCVHDIALRPRPACSESASCALGLIVYDGCVMSARRRAPQSWPRAPPGERERIGFSQPRRRLLQHAREEIVPRRDFTVYSGRLRGRKLRRSLRSPGGARGHDCGARLRARCVRDIALRLRSAC